MNTREQIVVNDSGFSSQISSETIDPGYTIGCKDGYVTVTYESNLIGTAATSQGLREIFINNGITESSEIHWGDSLDHAEKNGFSTEFEVFRLVMEALLEEDEAQISREKRWAELEAYGTRFSETGWGRFMADQEGFFLDLVSGFIEDKGSSKGLSGFDGEVDMLHFKYNLPGYVKEFGPTLSAAITKLFDLMGKRFDRTSWASFIGEADPRNKRMGEGFTTSYFKQTLAIIFFDALAGCLREKDLRMSLSAKGVAQRAIFELCLLRDFHNHLSDEVEGILTTYEIEFLQDGSPSDLSVQEANNE